MANPNNFGRVLWMIREIYGISKKELQHIIKIDYTTLRNYEIGESAPVLKNLILICNFFNLDFDTVRKIQYTNEMIPAHKLYVELQPRVNEQTFNIKQSLYSPKKSLCRVLKFIRIFKGIHFKDVSYRNQNDCSPSKINCSVLANIENYQTTEPEEKTLEKLSKVYKISIPKLYQFAEKTKNLETSHAAWYIAKELCNLEN